MWEWHIWDHLVQEYDSTKSNYGVVSQHPELYDINFGDMKADWLQFNGVRYNPSRDEIIVSLHATNEFLAIDHSTTKAEAGGHAGGKRGKGGGHFVPMGKFACVQVRHCNRSKTLLATRYAVIISLFAGTPS